MLDVSSARTLLRQTRPRRHADGYPLDVRSSVVALARTRLAQGERLSVLARGLELNRGTLERWLQCEPPVRPSFFSVVVEPTSEPVAVVGDDGPPRRPGALALVSPTGFRLDGLSLDDAIHALRELC